MEDLSNHYAFGGLQSLGDLFSALTRPLFAVVSVIVMIYLIVGAIRWMASGGDANALSAARRMMIHGVIGFFLLMMLFIFLQYITEFLGLTGFKIIQ